MILAISLSLVCMVSAVDHCTLRAWVYAAIEDSVDALLVPQQTVLQTQPEILQLHLAPH